MINFFKKIFFLKQKKTIYLIETDNDTDFVENNLIRENLIGIDTEFEWRSTYFPKLSLIQISTLENIFLIDCVKLKSLEFLHNILSNEEKLIIFHASRSDITVLNTNLGIKIKNVFDIQIAEKIINNEEIKSYGAIVNNYFSIILKKSETNSNWLKRPFSNDQLNYAAEDVSFLIEIYKKQVKKLNKLNLLEKVFNLSRMEANLGNQELYVSRLSKLKKASRLEKKIFFWREKKAEKRNVPPSKIFQDKNLKFLAKNFEKENFKEDFLTKIFKDSILLQEFIEEMNL